MNDEELTKTIKEIYEIIKEKRENALNDRLSKGSLSVYNPYIYELKGEIDAYSDVLTLIETSGVLDIKEVL